MKEKPNSIKDKMASHLLYRAIGFSCCLICAMFGGQYFGAQGAFLGALTGVLLAVLLLLAVEDRRGERATKYK